MTGDFDDYEKKMKFYFKVDTNSSQLKINQN